MFNDKSYFDLEANTEVIDQCKSQIIDEKRWFRIRVIQEIEKLLDVTEINEITSIRRVLEL